MFLDELLGQINLEGSETELKRQLEREKTVDARELWTGRMEEQASEITAEIPPHDAALFRIRG